MDYVYREQECEILEATQEFNHRIQVLTLITQQFISWRGEDSLSSDSDPQIIKDLQKVHVTMIYIVKYNERKLAFAVLTKYSQDNSVQLDQDHLMLYFFSFLGEAGETKEGVNSSVVL